MILVLDTETTGKVDRYMPPDHESQPHLVQIGLILAEPEHLVERASFCAIVRPEGYEIPAEASAIHGITTEIATHSGLPLRTILAIFDRFVRPASVLVAHNIEFDLGVLETAHLRLGMGTVDGVIGDRKLCCTMKAATPICRIPHANPRTPEDWKWPKLEECIRFFFNEDFQAHDALSDTRACLRIFGAIDADPP